MSHMHSLAASTGTRVDSAARHNMACKVDTKMIKAFMEQGPDIDKRLHVERMRFCVHKDELVMNVSRKMFRPDEHNAYPLVTSNLSELPEFLKNSIFRLYQCSSPTDFRQFVNILRLMSEGASPDHSMTMNGREGKLGIENLSQQQQVMMGAMPFFSAQGYAQGMGFASHVSGDTVCTVMIGGMATVMNGAFTCHVGDMIQWYLTGEECLFQQTTTKEHMEGERKPLNLDNPLPEHSANSAKRTRNQAFHDDNMFGMEKYSNKHKSANVFRIKPYRLARNPTGQYLDHYGDKIRVFAKCIGGGKPYEMIDVMLMTQSL